MIKKGELTSAQIVTLILVILGFAVVLMFLFFVLDFKGQTKNDLCEFSVVQRASVESIQEIIPLQCYTNKVCLSQGEKCSEFLGEEVDKQIKLSSGLSESELANKIMEVYANEMYDCWDMMGSGRFTLFSGAFKKVGLEGVELDCVICSRIAINLSKTDERKFLNEKINMREYLRTTKVPNKGITYMNAFTDPSVNAYADVKTDEGDLSKIREEAMKEKNRFESGTTEMAVVFTQIKPTDYETMAKELLKYGVASAGLAFLTPGLGSAAVGVVSTLPGAVLVGVGVGGVTAYSYSNVKEGRVIASTYCGPFAHDEEGAVSGCSTVQIIPYEVNTLNKICQHIEGYP